MNKDQIASSYLEETKARHLTDTQPMAVRRASVIGVDYDQAKGGNIGWAIADRLKHNFDDVYECNKTSLLECAARYDEWMIR